MPMLNLTSVLTSPMLASKFMVLRQATIINGHGETEVTTQRIGPVTGIVKPASADNMARLAEMQYQEKSLLITTRYGLRGVSASQKDGEDQPDRVEWPIGSNNQYIVQAVRDYSQWGSGWVQVIALSTDSTIAGPEPEPVPENDSSEVGPNEGADLV